MTDSSRLDYPDNPVARRSFLKWICGGLPMVMLPAGAALPSGCTRVEGTDRYQFAIIPNEQMVSLSDQAWKDIEKQEKRCKDKEAVAMVERLGKRLQAFTKSGTHDFDFRFTVFENDQANAFALPNGQVAIYTGIMKYCPNEAALAGIVGHEIAHIAKRHGNERMSQSVASNIVVQLAAVGLGTSDVDPETQKIAVAALGAGTTVGVLLPFSRAHELEADHFGTTYMAKAGYDPRDMPKFWTNFSKVGGQRPPEFLSTHPVDDTRVSQLEGRMREYRAHYKKAKKQLGSGSKMPARYRG